MNHLLEVCFVASTLTRGINAFCRRAVSGVDAKGISVELPITGNAVPMPDADQQNSLIVSVAGDGSLYFGADPISAAALAEKIQGGLFDPIKRNFMLRRTLVPCMPTGWKF